MARLFHFSTKVEDEDGERCEREEKDHLIVFFPRGEGAVQGGAGMVAGGLVGLGASIVLPTPEHQLYALVGWTKAVREAVRGTRAQSLSHLARKLTASHSLRRQYRVAFDTHGKIFHVLGHSARVSGGVGGEDGGRNVEEDVGKEGEEENKREGEEKGKEKAEESERPTSHFEENGNEMGEGEGNVRKMGTENENRMKMEVDEGRRKENELGADEKEGKDEKIDMNEEEKLDRNARTMKSEENKEEAIETGKIDEREETTDEKVLKGATEGKEERTKSRKPGNEEISIHKTKNGYRVRVGDRQPLILLANRTSTRARALLVAISDYLLWEEKEEEKILTGEKEIGKKEGKIEKQVEHGRKKTETKITPTEGDDEETKEDAKREEEEERGEKNTEEEEKDEMVLVGVFVRGPQPFLWEALGSLLQSGLNPAKTLYYVHNQVKEYTGVVERWVEWMRERGCHVEEMERKEEEADVRNHLLQECVRVDCGWLVNVDSTAFTNPGILSGLLHTPHPVIAPALRVQRGVESTFFRDLDPNTDLPVHSWDHAHLMTGAPQARGIWHASCVRGVYAVRRDVLALLSSPYTYTPPGTTSSAPQDYTDSKQDPSSVSEASSDPNHAPEDPSDSQHPSLTSQNPRETSGTSLTPQNPNHSSQNPSQASQNPSRSSQNPSLAPGTSLTARNPDVCFCRALRDAGVAMVMTTVEPNLGVLVNTTGHAPDTADLAALTSNPIIWHVLYLRPEWHQVMSGHLDLVGRSCVEVYQFPTFSQEFTQDLLTLAYRRNKWSMAQHKDSRKKGISQEDVPTVDQHISDLRLDPLFSTLLSEVFVKQQLLAFPYSEPNDIMLSLVARFRPGEVAGLPSHHNAAAITFYVTLSDPAEYQGGEVEFERQGCVIKPSEGDVLVFPGRLTHPITLHNVTTGTLHALIIQLDSHELRHSY